MVCTQPSIKLCSEYCGVEERVRLVLNPIIHTVKCCRKSSQKTGARNTFEKLNGPWIFPRRVDYHATSSTRVWPPPCLSSCPTCASASPNCGPPCAARANTTHARSMTATQTRGGCVPATWLLLSWGYASHVSTRRPLQTMWLLRLNFFSEPYLLLLPFWSGAFPLNIYPTRHMRETVAVEADLLALRC